MQFSIYQLVDPRNQLTCYVGYTFSMEQRLQNHLRGDGSNLAKDTWIRVLQEQGLQPIMRELEQVETEKVARNREHWWIRHFLDQGVVLLNINGASNERATEKVTAYFTPPQYDHIEELRRQYRKRTKQRISVNALLRRLVERANIEDILP